MAERGRRWVVMGLLTGTVAILGACTDGQDMGPTEPEEDARSAMGQAGAQRGGIRSWDEELAVLADQAPGFGGFFQEPGSDGLVVYASDPSRGAQVRAAVASFLQSRRTVHGPLEVRRGDYDFRDLARWRRSLDHARLEGITLTDVDERHNRVRVGVLDDAAGEGVRMAISRLGIPAAAVVVEKVEPTVIEVTLRDYYRPVQGGLLIATSSGNCTLGFVALEEHNFSISYYGPRYVITNSHCTSAFGQVYGDRIGQPDLANQIGTEMSDPPLFYNNPNQPDCPPGRACRWSDAAMFRLDDNSTSISRFSAVSRISSGVTLGSPDREYYVGKQFSVWGGMNVHKVGQATGRTQGTLTSSCATVPQYASSGGGVYDTGRTMICQMQASYGSSAGDSGSPVYHRDPSGQPVVLGIHWGSGGTFSYWTHVWSEIGNDVLARTGTLWSPALWDDRGNPYYFNP